MFRRFWETWSSSPWRVLLAEVGNRIKLGVKKLAEGMVEIRRLGSELNFGIVRFSFSFSLRSLNMKKAPNSIFVLN